MNNKFTRSMTDTRTYRGADIGSDHNLVLATIKLKLCRVVRPRGMRERYDVNKLRNPEIRKEFVVELTNRFSRLTEEEIEHEDQNRRQRRQNSLQYNCQKGVRL